MGSAMKNRLMIPDHKHRQVLHGLVQASSLSRNRNRVSGPRLEDCQPFEDWMDEHKPALKPFIATLRCSCSKTNVRIQSTQARFTHQYLQATVHLTFHCGLLVLSQHDEVILATPGLKVGMRGRFLGTGCRGLRGPLLVCRVFIHRPQVFARSSTKAGAVGSL